MFDFGISSVVFAISALYLFGRLNTLATEFSEGGGFPSVFSVSSVAVPGPISVSVCARLMPDKTWILRPSRAVGMSGEGVRK